jgi:hypothetical protein
MFVALMNSMIICHLVRSQQFAKQSMGSISRSMNTNSANVVVHIKLALNTYLMDEPAMLQKVQFLLTTLIGRKT